MQRQAEQPAFGGGVHGEIEHRRRLHAAAGHALHLPGRFLEHEIVVGPEEDDPDRLDDGPNLEPEPR